MSVHPAVGRAHPALRAYAWAFLAILYAPILLLPVFSFNKATYIAVPIEELTTEWCAELWGLRPIWARALEQRDPWRRGGGDLDGARRLRGEGRHAGANAGARTEFSAS